MKFTEALKKVYKSSRKKEQLNDPFLLYSRVSDLIGDSYNEIKKAKSFFSISKRVNLFALVGEYGENCQKQIIKKYGEVSDIITEDAFRKIVDIVYDVFFPSQKKFAPSPVRKQAAVKKAKVIKSEQPKEPEKRTPLKSNDKLGAKGTIAVFIILVLIMVGIATIPTGVGLAIYGVKYLCDNVPWDIGQWVIGIIGVIVASVITFLIGRWFKDESVLDYYMFGTFVLYVVGILNFTVKLFVADYLLPFFICVSAAEILAGIILALFTFGDIEEGWGWAQVISIFLNALLLGAVFVFNIT